MTDSVAIEIGDDHVATVELRRPPNNFFSLEMVAGIADALESLDDDPRCRAAVLCAQGKH
ncbi:MAG: enoyl-CoA hydratase/isomerase family protein, partial [Acidimicrobiaceae bacterium]|nr:enoyl-CoA hydratase/isomerase family protein [Acidimicrobiaceae bacterium]